MSTQAEMRPDAAWSAIVGEEHGPFVRHILIALTSIPKNTFREAVDRIEHEETIGPLINPTAYLDGRRWANAREYKAILSALHNLRTLLPEEVQRSGSSAPEGVDRRERP